MRTPDEAYQNFRNLMEQRKICKRNGCKSKVTTKTELNGCHITVKIEKIHYGDCSLKN